MKPKHLQTALIKVAHAAIVLVVVCAIFIASAPYMHDFAEWMYQGQIIKRVFTDPGAVAGFTMAAYPVPNSLVSAVLTGLSFILAPMWVGKVFLISMLLAWYGVISMFTARFVDKQWRPAATLVLYVSTALATFFWYGFASYQLALLLLTWFFAIYREDSKAYLIAIFGVAIFFSHAIIFLVFGLFLGVRLLLKWNWDVVAALLPATFLSLWFLVGRHLANVEPQSIDATWNGLLEALIYKGGYPAMLGPFKNFLLPEGTSIFESYAWVYWSGFVTNFAVAATFGALVLTVMWKFLKKATPGNAESALLQNAWAISIALLAVFYLFAPYHFFGVVNAGGRILVPMLLMAMMLGGNVCRPFVRLLVWPVAIIGLVTVGSYLYLMNQSRQPGFTPVYKASAGIQASDSVFDFNEQLYANTRYKYFNYRIFSFSRRFEQIETENFRGLTFRHAMLIKYEDQE